MLAALGAASSIWDALQSLGGANSSSSSTAAGQSQGASSPFDLGGSTAGTQTPVATGFNAQTSPWTQISPQTMSALIDAQGQSGTTSSAPTDKQGALQDLFSQIDGNGDGSITKSEFENALGAGGTNVAAADDVFGKLDSNDDGSVSINELKSALQGAGHHGGHHHMHASASSGSSDSTTADDSNDPTGDPGNPFAALQSGVPIKLTDLLIPIDKSQLRVVSLGASSAPSFDMVTQAIARVEQSFGNSTTASLPLNF